MATLLTVDQGTAQGVSVLAHTCEKLEGTLPTTIPLQAFQHKSNGNKFASYKCVYAVTVDKLKLDVVCCSIFYDRTLKLTHWISILQKYFTSLFSTPVFWHCGKQAIGCFKGLPTFNHATVNQADYYDTYT